MNEHFVSVKVDREERPDVDAIYMEAVQAMTGHGGWPMTVFLDPDGVPSTAAPTSRRREPRHAGLPDGDGRGRRRLRDQTRGDRERAPKCAQRLGAIGAVEPAPAAPATAELDGGVERLLAAVDRQHGGFGGAPKFPPPPRCELLLARGETEVVRADARRDVAGGIYDQLGGGFHRYSVDARWLVPHFEKMLYDNALLAPRLPARLAGARRRSATAASRGDARLRVARDARPRGRLLLGPGRRQRGRGGQVLRLAPGGDPRASLRRRGGGAAARVLRGHRARQLRGREHPPPGAGRGGARAAGARRGAGEAAGGARRAGAAGARRQGLLSWNALAISALAEAGAALGRDDYLEAARRCADFVWERDARRRRPPAPHLQGRRGTAQRLPRGPRLPARSAADASTNRASSRAGSRRRCESPRRCSSASPTPSEAASSRPRPTTRS